MRGMYSLQFLSEMFPPAPKYTEHDLPDLYGKVLFVTGGSIGLGYEVAKLLYSKNGTVYIAGRIESSALDAIDAIKAAHPTSKGKLSFQYLDLGDLKTIKPAVDDFLGKEERLDVLWNNAGVMVPPVGSTTAQGYEQQLGINCLGHFLLTQLLHPVIKQTAVLSEPGSVRIIWVASSAVHTGIKDGIYFEDPNNKNGKLNQLQLYSQSKIGDLFLAAEFSRRTKDENIISVSLNPGSLRTQIVRHMTPWLQRFLNLIMLYPPIYGAYTELFAGFSPEVTFERNGCYILPWGRFGAVKWELQDALKTKDAGGNGGANTFWEYCEAETKAYL